MFDYVITLLLLPVIFKVSHLYHDTQQLMATEHVKDYIPYSWLSMAQVKSEYYNALANHHVSEALLDQPGERFVGYMFNKLSDQ